MAIFFFQNRSERGLRMILRSRVNLAHGGRATMDNICGRIAGTSGVLGDGRIEGCVLVRGGVHASVRRGEPGVDGQERSGECLPLSFLP